MTCCDLHGRNCEPPSELCCEGCTEASHRWRTTPDHPFHEDGTRCSNPDLSGVGEPAEPRELVGRYVRQVWVAWAQEQPNPKPSWLLPWEDLDDGQREVDMRIGTDPSWCMWLMLNPSTADAKVNDATIRRCMRFAYLWGHDGIIVVNLFAWRSRNPKDLLTVGIDPVGPENDEFIRESAIRSDLLVCGWGATPFATTRTTAVVSKLWDPQCLGVTKTGEPRHPLMLPYSAPLQPFPPVADPDLTRVSS